MLVPGDVDAILTGLPTYLIKSKTLPEFRAVQLAPPREMSRQVCFPQALRPIGGWKEHGALDCERQIYPQ